MRISTSLILAGATVIGLAGLAPTVARELDRHTVTVSLPDGGVETITYTGTVAPRVNFQARPVFGPVDSPFVAFTPFPSFAALDRISAEMDRQMDVMLHQAQMMAAMPQDQALYNATLKGLPQGSTSFSMVSETTSNGVCTHVTRITQAAGDARPQMVSQTSGNCGEGAHSAAPSSNPDVKQISYHMPAARPLRSAL